MEILWTHQWGLDKMFQVFQRWLIMEAAHGYSICSGEPKCEVWLLILSRIGQAELDLNPLTGSLIWEAELKGRQEDVKQLKSCFWLKTIMDI